MEHSNQDEIGTCSDSSRISAVRKNFILSLRQRGLELHDVVSDGNSLFRAASFLKYGKEDKHFKLRLNMIQHLDKNRRMYINMVDEPYDAYLSRMSNLGTSCGDLELNLLSSYVKKQIDVYH